jgi:2-desacetyl-2-hydroxyethyl bacteriochlorophyllide A dehydrogenase
MKALRIDKGVLQLTDIDPPDRRGEALVCVTMAGICNTDLEIIRGYANFGGTLGHEFTGVVENSPDESQIGSRVVGEINAGCGKCDLCLQRDPRHCLNRTVLGIHNRDGAFAEYLTLPPENLMIIPDAVSDRQAVFTEPLAAACEILDQVAIDRSQRVAVIGDGKLGQLIARVLAATGCDPILVGKHTSKLKLASDAGINTIELDRMKIDPANRFDCVIEASGASSGLDLAVNLVRPRGTIVLKSTFHGAVKLDTSRVVVDEITIIGSRCGRFERALELLEAGVVDVEPLIASEFNLANGVAAMAEAQQPGMLKVLIRN